MNERIREFVRESHLDVYGLGKDHQQWETVVGKFAELIVRECCNVILEWKAEPFPLDPDFAAKLIREHFGVEK